MSVIGGKTQFPIRAVISSLLETGNVLCPEISSHVVNSKPEFPQALSPRDSRLHLLKEHC